MFCLFVATRNESMTGYKSRMLLVTVTPGMRPLAKRTHKQTFLFRNMSRGESERVQSATIFLNSVEGVFLFFVSLAFDFCRFCMVIRFFIPATMVNDLRLRRIFYPRLYPLHLFSYLNPLERDSIFPFECSVLNNGTTGTIFITSLV